jgi:hypothetical protein
MSKSGPTNLFFFTHPLETASLWVVHVPNLFTLLFAELQFKSRLRIHSTGLETCYKSVKSHPTVDVQIIHCVPVYDLDILFTLSSTWALGNIWGVIQIDFHSEHVHSLTKNDHNGANGTEIFFVVSSIFASIQYPMV